MRTGGRGARIRVVAFWAVAAITMGPTLGASLSASTIDTTPAWDYWGAVGGLGTPSILTMGQTFVAPATQLDSFTFWLKAWQGGPPQFYAYVMEWDAANSLASGAPLWQSGLQEGPSGDFTPYTFTPDVGLNAGGVYVAFLSATGLFDYDNYELKNSLFGAVTSGNTNPYPGGNLVWNGGGWYWGLGYDDFSLLTTHTWSDQGYDAAFQASFSGAGIPEPTSIVLFCAGLAVTGMAGWRRGRW